MGTARLVGRGLSDTLEHLLLFSLLTLTWWLAMLLIVPGPGATVALFAMTDPRRAIDLPEWREAIAVARRSLRRGWALALLVLPVPTILIWNLSFYAGEPGRLGLLIPLWLILLALVVAIGAYAFSVSALLDAPAIDGLRQGAWIVVARPGRAIVVGVVGWLLVLLGGVLVVPLVMFVPAMVAAIVNRVVIAGLGLTVTDPLAPTNEQLHEERVRRSRRSRFGP